MLTYVRATFPPVIIMRPLSRAVSATFIDYYAGMTRAGSGLIFCANTLRAAARLIEKGDYLPMPLAAAACLGDEREEPRESIAHPFEGRASSTSFDDWYSGSDFDDYELRRDISCIICLVAHVLPQYGLNALAYAFKATRLAPRTAAAVYAFPLRRSTLFRLRISIFTFKWVDLIFWVIYSRSHSAPPYGKAWPVASAMR